MLGSGEKIHDDSGLLTLNLIKKSQELWSLLENDENVSLSLTVNSRPLCKPQYDETANFAPTERTMCANARSQLVCNSRFTNASKTQVLGVLSCPAPFFTNFSGVIGSNSVLPVTTTHLNHTPYFQDRVKKRPLLSMVKVKSSENKGEYARQQNNTYVAKNYARDELDLGDDDDINIDLSGLESLEIENKNKVFYVIDLFRQTHYLINDSIPHACSKNMTDFMPVMKDVINTLPNTMSVQTHIRHATKRCYEFSKSLETMLVGTENYDRGRHLACVFSMQMLRRLIHRMSVFIKIKIQHNFGVLVSEADKVNTQRLADVLRQLNKQIVESHCFVKLFKWASKRKLKLRPIQHDPYTEIKNIGSLSPESLDFIQPTFDVETVDESNLAGDNITTRKTPLRARGFAN